MRTRTTQFDGVKHVCGYGAIHFRASTVAQQQRWNITSDTKCPVCVQRRLETHQQVSGDHTHLDVCPTLTAKLECELYYAALAVRRLSIDNAIGPPP